MLRFEFVTLFPEMVLDALKYGVVGRAAEAELVSFSAVNPRDFTTDIHKTVDDSPYGGGPGMVMKAAPLFQAMHSIGIHERPELGSGSAVVIPEPSGDPLTQDIVREFAGLERITVICGRYEGMDFRVEQQFASHVVSLGDYVLSGGEIAALALADAVTRLVPGVLGNGESLSIDSFSDGLLSAPQYTRPEVYEGLSVPPVLLSGDHAAVAKWRKAEALRLTQERRPDLID